MTTEAALDAHHATLRKALARIGTHDALRHELVEALRLQAAADRAASENLKAILTGEDSTQTQAAMDAAMQAISEFEGGRWMALFWFLQSPYEDLTHEQHSHH